VKENRLALLPVDRILGGSYTAQEVEERTSLPAGLMTQIRRLWGLPQADPQDRVFSDDEIEAARSTKLFLDAGFDQEAIIETTRVLGEGMARLAATITASFTETFMKPGDSEADVALRFAELAEQLTPALAPVLVAGLKAHLRDSVRRGMLGRAELEAGGISAGQEIAVCFADLVGFTRLGGQVELARARHRGGAPREPRGLGDRAAGAADQDDRRRGDVRQPRPGAAREGGAGAGGSGRGGRPAESAGGPGDWTGARASGRLLRPFGQPGQPSDGNRAPGERPLHAGGPRRGRGPIRVVSRR